MINQDILSLLPDNLLFIILSFLPFKEAVRISKLSHRWRSIPLGTRSMEFDEKDFVKQPLDSEENRQNKRRAFVDFAMRWIEKYEDSAADKFRLTFSHPEDHLLQIQQSIIFAIDRKVKVLDLDFSDPTWNEDNIEHHNTFLQLPMINDVDYRSSIESLRLFSCDLPTIPQTSQNFSALKSVSLGWIALASDSITNLLEKCPALENLSTKKCSFDGDFEFIGPRLKNLVLEKCFPRGLDDIFIAFVIDAPNLRFFKYSGTVISLENGMSKLEEAELDFGLQSEYDEYGDILYRLLLEIASVKTLTLCSYMLQAIPTGEEAFKLKPALGCLKHLILKTSLHPNEFYGISFFLNSCPNLEILTIDLNFHARIFPEYEAPCDIKQHAFLISRTSKNPPIFSCVEKKLKSVVVKGFKGEPNEVVVVRYLLKFGKVLDSLHIKISKESAADGTTMEATYVKNLEKLLLSRIANEKLRVFLSRR